MPCMKRTTVTMRADSHDYFGADKLPAGPGVRKQLKRGYSKADRKATKLSLRDYR